MDIEKFRKNAHELVDWMADYLRDLEEYPVRAQVSPGEILKQLPSNPPSRSDSFEEIFDDFQKMHEFGNVVFWVPSRKCLDSRGARDAEMHEFPMF